MRRPPQAAFSLFITPCQPFYQCPTQSSPIDLSKIQCTWQCGQPQIRLTTLTILMLIWAGGDIYICSYCPFKNPNTLPYPYMKKFKLILTLGLFAGITMFSACGSGTDEAAEKARLDSLRADSTMKADAEKRAMDSIAAADAAAKAVMDSVAAADAAAAAGGSRGGSTASSKPGGDAGTKGTGSSGVTTTGGDAGTKGTGSSGVKGSGTTSGPTGVKGSGTQSGSSGPTGVKGKYPSPIPKEKAASLRPSPFSGPPLPMMDLGW
jgi:hypothetical protein